MEDCQHEEVDEVSYDVTGILKAVPTQHVTIPNNLNLIIELEDAAYNELRKDPVWTHRVHDIARDKADPVLNEIKKRVADADRKASKFDKKTADIFSKDLDSDAKSEMRKLAPQVPPLVDKFFGRQNQIPIRPPRRALFHRPSDGTVFVVCEDSRASIGLAVVDGGACFTVSCDPSRLERVAAREEGSPTARDGVFCATEHFHALSAPEIACRWASALREESESLCLRRSRGTWSFVEKGYLANPE